MKLLIAGGSGLVGGALINHLLKSNITKSTQYHITVLGRKKSKLAKLCYGIQSQNKDYEQFLDYISWRELEYEQSNSVDLMAQYDVVINLCGQNIGDKRWSDKYKQEIINSRVKPTALLANLCSKVYTKFNKKICLYNASAIGIFGIHDSQTVFTEDTKINYRTTDFLSTVALQWEAAAKPAIENNIRVVFMRFAVVLDWHGGALPRVALPFYLGLGGRVGSGNQPFTWIDIKDLVRIIEVLINNTELQGPINLVAPQLITQHEFAKALANYLHRPCIAPLPAFVVRILFGQMGQELLLSGTRVSSNKLPNCYTNWISPNIQQFFKMESNL